MSRQQTNAPDPAEYPTPKGFRRLGKGEILKKGDLFLHCRRFEWLDVSTIPIQENYYTNAIRPIGEPIALLPEICSA